ncbi:biotin/lipoyl-binding protein, partial [Gemmobacter sp.]|uniref:biotin/lipoyl-binding protein n=1 Tax=Gemmobacter sp. TaxID=1898957 RepID=UPI0025B874A1
MAQPDPAARTWSARRHIWLGMGTLAVLLGGFGVWSVTTNIAGAVVASGQIEVESHRQVVQHPDGGVVADIQVKEGQAVQAGDLLIQLDGADRRSELAIVEGQLFELMARRARLTA